MEYKPTNLSEWMPADEQQLQKLYYEAMDTTPNSQFALKHRGWLLSGPILIFLCLLPFIGIAAVPFAALALLLILGLLFDMERRNKPELKKRVQNRSHVLATVAEYVMREPLEQRKHTLLSIEHSIVRLNRSLTVIEPIVRSHQDLFDNASTEATKILFASRLERANDVRLRLFELRDELIDQKAQAKEVLRPMQLVLEELKKLDALEHQIETIARAHKVAAEAERRSDEYDLRIASLKSAATETDGRLRAIATRLGPALEKVDTLERSTERLELSSNASTKDRLSHLSESNKR